MLATLRPQALPCLGALALAACEPAPPPPAAGPAAPPAGTIGYAAAHAGDSAVVAITAHLARAHGQGKRMVATRVQAAGLVHALHPATPAS